MDKKLKIIRVMTLFFMSFSQFSRAGYADFMSSFDADLKKIDVQNAAGMSTIQGDADRLIEGMGEIPTDLVDSRSWYNPIKYLSGVGSYFTYYTNSSALRYHNKQVYTQADFVARKTAWLQALNKNYASKFSKIQELINYLMADIDALKNKKNMAQDKNLREYLERMVFVAEEGLERFMRVKNLDQEKEVNNKLDQLLASYIPSATSKKILKDCLADAEQGLIFAKQAKDELSAAAHLKIIAFLHEVEREITVLKRNQSLEKALITAQDKLSSLKRNQITSGGSAFDLQLKLYDAVIGGLQAELEQEIIEIEKSEAELSKVNTLVSGIIARSQSVKEADIQAKEDLKSLESTLQRLENLRNPANRRMIEDLKLKIKDQYLVLQQLDLKLKEEQDAEMRQDRIVRERVEKLLIKHNFNISKALTEALNLIGTPNQSSSVKIAMIKNKKDLYQKLSDDEKIVLYLDQKLQEEKLNDPFDIALKKLSMAKTVDIPQALESVIAAALGKIGLSIDRLDMVTRQNLADDLKLTSAELIKIMENPALSEQQKQIQKQVVVKEMLNRNSSLLISGITGASVAALQTGNAQTIATDIALNKLVNTLVPTSTSAFDLSAMSY